MDKRKDKNMHAASAITGSMISMICAIIACLLLTSMVSNEVLTESQVQLPTMLITVLAAAFGAAYTALKSKENVLLWCVCQGVVFYMLLIGINAIAFDGMYTRVGVTAICIAVTVSSVAILYSITKQRKGNRHNRR